MGRFYTYTTAGPDHWIYGSGLQLSIAIKVEQSYAENTRKSAGHKEKKTSSKKE